MSRTLAAVTADVHATVGHRCTDGRCPLERDDEPTYTVLLDIEPRSLDGWPFLAVSMCNPCVTDVRRSCLTADLNSIRRTR